MLIRLEHYSHKNGLTVIDPAFEGTGIRGEEAKRRINYAQFWVPRSCWYVTGHDDEEYIAVEREPRVTGLPYRYTTTVESNDLYDWRDDPYSLWPQDMPAGEQITRYEYRIRSVGYSGIIFTGGNVRLFIPVPCTQETRPTL